MRSRKSMFGDVSQNQYLMIIIAVLVVAVAYLFFHKKSPFGAGIVPANTSNKDGELTQINVGARCMYQGVINMTTHMPDDRSFTNPKKDGTTVLSTADGTAKLGLAYNGALFIISTKGIKILNENVDKNGKYSLKFQSDGNVVLYKTNDNNKVIWHLNDGDIIDGSRIATENGQDTSYKYKRDCVDIKTNLLGYVSSKSTPGYYKYTVTSNEIQSQYSRF